MIVITIPEDFPPTATGSRVERRVPSIAYSSMERRQPGEHFVTLFRDISWFPTTFLFLSPVDSKHDVSLCPMESHHVLLVSQVTDFGFPLSRSSLHLTPTTQRTRSA